MSYMTAFGLLTLIEPHKQFARARANGSRPSSPRGPTFDHAAVSGTDGRLRESSQVVTTRFRPQPAVVTEIDDDQSGVYAETPSSYTTDEARRPSRPLLMPPPRSRTAEMRDNIYLVLVYLTTRLLGPQRDLPNQLVRIGFFLVKVLTVMSPCWPYMSRMELSLPLLIGAALDLRVPDPGSATVARRTVDDAIEFGPARLRGLGWSAVLLVLHLIFVWGVRRWDALCVVPTHGAWERW